jgi:hypothetical protein
MSIQTKNATEQALAEGKLFSVPHTSPSIAAAGTYLVGFLTGSRPVEFLDRYYNSTLNSADIALYEVTWSGGTPIPSGNRNFEIGGAAPSIFSAAPTATIVGNPVATVKLLAGAGTGNAQIGLVSESERYILKKNTRYVLQITNTDVGAGVVTFRYTFRDTEVVL